MNKDVIIALDFPTLEDTLSFLEKFGEEKLFVKVGWNYTYKMDLLLLKKLKN